MSTTTAVVALTAASAAADQMGLDWVASDNVEYLGSIKQDIGLKTGAKVVGNRLFVTSGKNITIYDISKPETPRTLGSMKINISWQNEEVPTNGKVLAFASDSYSATEGCLAQGNPLGCVEFFDVRDPSDIKSVGAIPHFNHTVECALDCTWFYGQTGAIIDARRILDGRAPSIVGNWKEVLRTQGVDSRSCHHIREIRPGVLLTACQPFAVITINAKDAKGASPRNPKVLYTGVSDAFVHSARWPRSGQDKFALTGGELNATGRCEFADSDFRVYSAEGINSRRSKRFEGPIASVAPPGNGLYVDGNPPVNHLGCSMHWFQEHRSFRNGGLVALSEYENGVRFLQIRGDGKIVEQGFFAALGGASSSSKWAPKGDVVYSVDYDRGIDIIRWKGRRYVPKASGRGLEPETGRMRGTNGASVLPALTKTQDVRRASLASELAAQGWSPFACRLAAER
ncbi:MAG: hypothetical protein ACRDKJ_09885 [Actinomycetota bacterium]